MTKTLSWEWWQTTANKPAATFMFAFHLCALCILHPYFFSWSGVFIFLFMYWVSGGLGITLCYHRLLTHASFKTFRVIRMFLAWCGCLALQGGPARWIGTHRYHHIHSDKDGDPHTPVHGFNWAHALWAVSKDPPGFDPKKIAGDINRDPTLNYLHAGLWIVPQLFVSMLLFTIGYVCGGIQLALSWFVWDTARLIAVYHNTWFVNSACHTWGTQRFKTNENSRNLWWVALLTFGEGWHNNHHHNQASARHGMKWYEIDPTWWVIWTMEKLGLAWDVKRPKNMSA